MGIKFKPVGSMKLNRSAAREVEHGSDGSTATTSGGEEKSGHVYRNMKNSNVKSPKKKIQLPSTKAEREAGDKVF